MYRISGHGRIAYAADDLNRRQLRELLRQPETLLRSPASEVVKAGGTSLLVQTSLTGRDGPVAVAYKRVRRRGWLDRVKAALRSNRILRCWKLAEMLGGCGVLTARPVAAVIPSKSSSEWEGFLATEWILGGRPLGDAVRDRLALPEPQRRDDIRRLMDTLAGTIACMHSAGIGHRDLKHSNLIIVKGTAETTDVYVIDLDGMRRRRWLTRRRRCRDLARLLASIRQVSPLSASHYLWFLLRYLRYTGQPSRCWKTMWNRIRRSAERKQKW